MRHVETDTKLSLVAKTPDVAGIDKDIVKALSAEMPWEGWHRLRQ